MPGNLQVGSDFNDIEDKSVVFQVEKGEYSISIIKNLRLSSFVLYFSVP